MRQTSSNTPMSGFWLATSPTAGAASPMQTRMMKASARRIITIHRAARAVLRRQVGALRSQRPSQISVMGSRGVRARGTDAREHPDQVNLALDPDLAQDGAQLRAEGRDLDIAVARD